MSSVLLHLNNDIVRLAQEIERYLLAHPRAGDSVEGIAKWWLPRQRYQETSSRVQEALENLSLRGVVTKIQHPDGRQIYTRCKIGTPTTITTT